MAGLSKDRRGLSQVITTLILLVVSVLLAGVVTYYATNITMTRTALEELKLTDTHAWINSTDSAEVAFVVRNVGGRDVLMDKIAIRGVEVPWANIYFNATEPTEDLKFILYANLTTEGLTQAEDDVPVESGGIRTVYIKDPGDLHLTDIGTTVSITIYTVNSQWIKEVNVEYGAG